MSYKIEFIPRGNLIKQKSKADSVQSGYLNTFYQYVERHPGGGNTPLQEANRDVPLDGVAFSRLE